MIQYIYEYIYMYMIHHMMSRMIRLEVAFSCPEASVGAPKSLLVDGYLGI